MLPSTGYFKGINCPFYDSGLCERPYCHFRHVKKECSANAQNDGIESGAILQKLVSAAVQKVLQQKETTAASPTPSLVPEEEIKVINNTQSKATYNPTPIAELKKIINEDLDITDDIIEQRRKHIPVPYTPRKPNTLPIKRPTENNGSSSPLLYLPPPATYTPGSTDATQLDPYTPQGSIESTEKYLPGVEKEVQEYTVRETHTSSRHSYVPSDKNVNKKKILEYKPTKISKKTDIPILTYQPTPKALVPCFSSDEDEPEPKKAKIVNDLNGLDDLGPEFDILGEILDDEKAKQQTSINVHENELNQSIVSKESKQTEKDANKVKKAYEKQESQLTSNKTDNKLAEKQEDKRITDKHDVKKLYEKKDERKTSERQDERKTSDKQGDKSLHKTSEKRPSDKQDNKKSSEKNDKKSAHKTDEKKSTHKHDDKKSSHKHNDKKSSRHEEKKSSKHESKESQEKIKSEKKEKSSSHSKSKSKEDIKKSHKSSSKEKSRDEKRKDSEKEKHSKSNNKSSSYSSKRKDRNDHKSSTKSSKERHKKDKEPEITTSDVEENEMHYEEEDKEEYSSESDQEAIEMECKRIFEEYVPTPIEKKDSDDSNSHLAQDAREECEYIPTKKRISYVADKNIKVIRKAPLKPDYKVSAAQAMAERLTKVKEYHASRQPNVNSVPSYMPEPVKTINNIAAPASSKIRIAHVPYASTLINAKKGMPPSQKSQTELPSTSSTTIQTIKKGTQRVAHIPNEKFIDRPGVLEPLASKIPANIRSTYLNMMIDECLKIYLSATDAYARAQHEELTTSKKCSTVQIYKNSAVLTVSRLRKEFQECNGIKKSGADCTALQKIPVGSSAKTNSLGSWSIESKKMVDTTGQFTGARFYNNIKKWILTEEQLQENGFPRPHSSGERGKAIIYGQNKQIPPKGLIRTCCRCKKDYIVDKKGFPAITEECIYHPNNKYRVRGEVKYQCCSQDSSSDGCCVAPSHVYEYVDFDNLKGFIKTMPPETEMDDYGVYSLDCEMCYTTHGLDLTRVTVINSNCKVVYETLIKPLHPIIDYNTRYSGITEEQMANVKTTLLEVQATLLSMFNSKTILVGHSLESDFKALKLIHDTVIDTSVLFPHKMGPPYKRALRNLSSEYLKKIIQNSVDGHDSAEDATVCMELLIYKLKEDLKTR